MKMQKRAAISGMGGFVRKMLEETEMNLAERISQADGSEITTKLITTIEERYTTA